MIGSVLIEGIIDRVLTAEPDVVATFGESIHGLSAVPPGDKLPALLYYMPTPSTYDGALSVNADDINAETLTFHVVAMCEGTSHAPIRDAVRAQLRLLAGLEVDEVDDEGRNYHITFTARGETPIGSIVTAPSQFYRRLGTVYDVEVTRED